MTNQEYQESLVDLIESGFLILSESERFAHQLKQRARGRHLTRGTNGWEGVAVHTLNQWLLQFWEDLWPESWPAGQMTCWYLLSEEVRENPGLGIGNDPGLIADLDESISTCLRYGIDPGRGGPANPLVEWRRKIWRGFTQRLSAMRLFHPSELGARVYEALSTDSRLLPDNVVVAGFEFPAYWESRLIDLLTRGEGERRRSLPMARGNPRVLSFADPEQELYWILEDIVEASTVHQLHDIGLCILDPSTYCPSLEKHLQDVFGPPLQGAMSSYNLIPDKALADHPLFHSAFLPLQFVSEGQGRRNLLGLLRSPYYHVLARHASETSMWDRTWRDYGIESGLEALLKSDRPSAEAGDHCRQLLREHLGMLTGLPARGAGEWVRILGEMWAALEFPIITGELDRIAWDRLQRLLAQMIVEFPSEPISAESLLGWIVASAARTRIQKSGAEDAGIQLIGRLDMRGLSLARLYVPGFLAGVLPQPARDLPFHSPEERRRVLGGTSEEQFKFGRHLASHIGSVAPEVILSRPLMSMGGEPLLASPFLPDAIQETICPVLPWRHVLPCLRRADWVRDAVDGLLAGSRPGVEARIGHANENQVESLTGMTEGRIAALTYAVRDPATRNELPVSSLDTICWCLSAYFFRELLGVSPLPEFVRGLDPPRRGSVVHDCLAKFGKTMIDHGAAPPELPIMLKRLSEVVDDVFARCEDIPYWRVEKRRLLGDGGDNPGLLSTLLEKELERFTEGWRWVAAEKPFSGLRIEGCEIKLKGRVDRLDFHPEHGFLCWDYKTGKPPDKKKVKELEAPQLPAYLAAFNQGLVVQPGQSGHPVNAGYVDLRSIKNLQFKKVLDDADIESVLSEWESRMARSLNRLCSGDMGPRWHLEASCDRETSCEYRCLCGVAR